MTELEKKHSIITELTSLILFGIAIAIFVSYPFQPEGIVKRQEIAAKEEQCFKTCRLKIVESIPTNLTFGDAILPMSTFEAWSQLINNAQRELIIAAYKSSLQGKHVLEKTEREFSEEGDSIYSEIMSVGKSGKVQVKMVENYPPKDKGDNADGIILQNHGAVNRKSIDISKHLGRGKMHSKFLISDESSFYLGSANLDWRSLNQKMELGVLVEDCSCLAEDLKSIFNVLWGLQSNDGMKQALKSIAKYNMQKPLKMSVQNEPASVYIATSPKELNSPSRTWDLDAIVNEIDNSREFLDVHVMDYFPLFVYRNPRVHFDVIDDAIRRAIVRGVRVRMLAAALHYPEIGVRFLRSLQSLNRVHSNGTVSVKIFKVPMANTESIVINRERRTHNKFMVTEKSVIIGTSNWSGDYFVGGTTGAAIVIQQTGNRRPLVNEMKNIFERDWQSDYAHPLEDYYEQCIRSNVGEFCETKKDPRLFANRQQLAESEL